MYVLCIGPERMGQIIFAKEKNNEKKIKLNIYQQRQFFKNNLEK